MFDEALQSRVIELSPGGSNPIADGFAFESDSGELWNNRNQRVAEWSMNVTSPRFLIYFHVETTAGTRYIYYNESTNSRPHYDSRYIHIGLGAANDGTWRTFARDLQADLQTDSQNTGEEILRVERILVRAKGRFDNIRLMDAMPASPSEMVYEDAEDGAAKGWRVFDNRSGKARIGNVYDEVLDSQVIKVTPGGTNLTADGFVLERDTGTLWQNRTHFVAQWTMKITSPRFKVYFLVRTTKGFRYIYYNESKTNSHNKSPQYAHIGLGTVNDGVWRTFTRDLQADLMSDPQNADEEILSVERFLVRGQGRFDNIGLLKTFPPAPPETVYEDAEDWSTKGWRIYANRSKAASFGNVYDDDRMSRVIELRPGGENLSSDGFLLETDTGVLWNNRQQFVAQWDMSVTSPEFMVSVLVKTTAGFRYIYYDGAESNTHRKDPRYIHIGLGAVNDGDWHTFKRDLEADLQTDPDNEGETILSVNRFLVRGKGRFDDIKLRSELDD